MNHSNRGILANCTPTEVFRFFEELCSIPHGSSPSVRKSWVLSESFSQTMSV